MLMYSSAPTVDSALEKLQKAFNWAQSELSEHRLTLNADKNKLMLRTKSKTKVSNHHKLWASKWESIEVVHRC